MSARPAEPAASGPVSTPCELVEAHLPLVDHLVRERLGKVPAHVRRDELTSAGLMALVLSAHSYDPERGVPFAPFAAIRIRGALMDELRSMDWAPRSLRCRARDVEAVTGRLAVELKRIPEPHEVAEAMNVEVRELTSLVSDLARATVISLHALPPDVECQPALEDADGPESVLLRREQLGYLHAAVDALPDRLRQVVIGYFMEQRQMRDIATDLGVTQSRVSQMCSQAIALMRDGINSQLDPSPAPRPQTGRAAIARNAYLSAVAASGSLSTRLAVSTSLGEAIPPRRPTRPLTSEQVA